MANIKSQMKRIKTDAKAKIVNKRFLSCIRKISGIVLGKQALFKIQIFHLFRIILCLQHSVVTAYEVNDYELKTFMVCLQSDTSNMNAN